MRENITRVGMDAHKREHQVAIRFAGREKVVEMRIRNDGESVRRFVKKVVKQSDGAVEICYEAGPCGFHLKRQIESHGAKCEVVAPSLIPVKPGEHIKTDRRDAKKLLELYEANILTMIQEPTESEEAVRDLCRCREAIQKDLQRMKHRLNKFLLRHGVYYKDGRMWTQKHMCWLRGIKFENPHLERTFEEYFSQVDEQIERLKRMDQELEEAAQTEPYRKPVAWLKCLKGVQTVTALSLVAELYSIERFESARELMAYLGLTVCEDSSGESRRQGGITKAGNRRVRRLLVECAWNYTRGGPIASKTLRVRREGQPEWVIKIGETAQKRLYWRYQRFVNKGKSKKLAVVAVARELAGFVWAVLHGPLQQGKQRANAD